MIIPWMKLDIFVDENMPVANRIMQRENSSDTRSNITDLI